jgi:hypothetical protein
MDQQMQVLRRFEDCKGPAIFKVALVDRDQIIQALAAWGAAEGLA